MKHNAEFVHIALLQWLLKYNMHAKRNLPGNQFVHSVRWHDDFSTVGSTGDILGKCQ